MADRFWVGGTATWDATAGTKWSATSGGPGGASVPGQLDDVFFDAASGAVTVTVSGTRNMLSLNCTGFTGTITGTGSIQFFGNFTLSAGMTWSHTANVLSMASSGSWTITTAGKTLGSNLSIGSNGGTATWTLQDALTLVGNLTVTQGTFTTNNFNVTAQSLSSSNSNTRTINLGSSTVTLTGNSGVNVSINTNLTFNAGTSQINLTSSAPQLSGGSAGATGLTFNNVSYTNIGSGSVAGVNGINTINNLTVAGPAAAGLVILAFNSSQTINGTLSTTGTAGNRRVWFRGATYGIAQTLTINSAPSLTDADFRDIYVIGTAAPISGTRIGDLRGCRGITFDAPKTVYWNLAGAQNWSANGWSDTSTGTPNTNFFPLAQDTATFTNAGSVTGLITMDGSITYTGTIDLSGRTSAMNLAVAAYSIYGNITLGSGVTLSGSNAFTLSGRNTQVITSAGKTFSNGITIDSYGGTVELADALNNGANNPIIITNGTFDTKNYNVSTGGISSSNNNVRSILFGSSTVTVAGTVFNLSATNLTFNAGTSQITLSNPTAFTFAGANQTFYNVSFTATATQTISGANTFNNLSVAAPSSAGIRNIPFDADQIINGTLSVAGATAVRRIFLRSNTLGTTRTLTVNSLSATDCDFRDITIAGAAAGSSPTRAGDCGGNTGITFPAPKTVYWVASGSRLWTDQVWSTTSGGTTAINNFPLAQDTAVFNNSGGFSPDAQMVSGVNIGSIDMSTRTDDMTLTINTSNIYGNWSFGTGVTTSSTAIAPIFSGRGVQTITSNGVSFFCSITIDCTTGTVQLADALRLTSARTLTLTSGTFDAVTYNVTTGAFAADLTTFQRTLRMGSGTWTISGTGALAWVIGATNFNLFKGTADIVFSDNSTTARSFNGAGLSYNKLTIGGTTGTSTMTIAGNNQFTELASTKTVAHTISFAAAQTLGAWTVTGTAGNVVTVTGAATLTIAGARVSGVNFLAMGTTAISTTSPGEFYAGANSTGTGAGVILTAAPTPVTRYWRGGTGTWDATTTTNWSASSGGPGGASVPTSADAVIFDSASNATAYTVTCYATQLRCGSLTMAGPASGNVTWAGTAPITIHDNVSLAATGITRTYTGQITLSGSTIGKTINTNGVTLGSTVQINGVGCEWTLGGAINSSLFRFINGTFSTNNYNLTTQGIQSDYTNSRTVNFGSSVVSISGFNTPVNLGTTANEAAALTFNAGTSQFLIGPASFTFSGNNQTFYNVDFTSTATGVGTLNGANTFNNLSVTGITAAGLKEIVITANQTINGTLTLSAGTNATARTFVRSNTIGETRTLTCAAVASLTDIDFRDITIAGAAAPVSGTRLGDCRGNSGITFPAAKTVYYENSLSGSWTNTNIWALSVGGATSANNFPLAQDTVIFQAAKPNSGTTITVNAAYNIGTIDMSARTSNTMTLATGSNTPTIYGDWINGTGTTLSGTVSLIFAGRGSQTVTSAGKTFTQAFSIQAIGGAVTLMDALVISRASASAINVLNGTFDANGYNVTLSDAASAGFTSAGSLTRTVAIGSGTWTIVGSNGWNASPSTNLTVTGTGTISLTSASSKTFAGGGISYSGITLDQGGAGTLTITGNNTFRDITSTHSNTSATSINFGSTTQSLSRFTAKGFSGKVLSLSGLSASSPATLIFTGTNKPNSDYLSITGIGAYDLNDTWYAGDNSINNGSLGWNFSRLITVLKNIFYGSNNPVDIYLGSTPVVAIYYGNISVWEA
jgi:hypothetical protein